MRSGSSPTVGATTTEAEIEEFFAAAETDQAQRFADKYTSPCLSLFLVILKSKASFLFRSVLPQVQLRRYRRRSVGRPLRLGSDQPLKRMAKENAKKNETTTLSFRLSFMIFPNKTTSLACGALDELVKVIKIKQLPVVLVSFSLGSRGCMYKVLQVGVVVLDVRLKDILDYYSFTSILSEKMQQELGLSMGPLLIFSSEDDDLAPYQVIFNFSLRPKELGVDAGLVKWSNSPHVGES
ncbi:cyclin-dependent kinase inhibitor [Musa troglodytarum]|uniref:Cyclin-dependent kinase inhibitor n=1 Tax=Musa troglodytarum TaxID=320322 RepID=A0A9E7I5I6_9LILI|nr:cyclin-dependent kinase inhibitor [Musa troglodytarum]